MVLASKLLETESRALGGWCRVDVVDVAALIGPCLRALPKPPIRHRMLAGQHLARGSIEQDGCVREKLDINALGKIHPSPTWNGAPGSSWWCSLRSWQEAQLRDMKSSIWLCSDRYTRATPAALTGAALGCTQEVAAGKSTSSSYVI